MTYRHFFFFQAEDGIRDLTVTGVQTCALPISLFRTVIVDVSLWIERTVPLSWSDLVFFSFASAGPTAMATIRSEEHTSELQSQSNLVCRLLLEKKKTGWSAHIVVRPHAT